jgi:hypothetical protein
MREFNAVFKTVKLASSKARKREPAIGGLQVTEKHSYRVTIPYREPVFDKHRGLPERIYNVDYEVVAENGEEATLKAFEEFFSDSSNSEVGWDRIPDKSKVTIELLSDAGEKAK